MTDEQMKQYAKGAAEGFFYCDDEMLIPWEPFEDWPENDVREECDNLASVIYNAMKEAKNGQA